MNRACQPCANAKVKCDDDRPCGRCRQEGITAQCVDRLVKIRKPRSKANGNPAPNDGKKKKKLTSNRSPVITLATVIPSSSCANYVSSSTCHQQFFQVGSMSPNNNSSSAASSSSTAIFIQSSFPPTPPTSVPALSSFPKTTATSTQFSFSLNRQISLPNDLLLQCPPRFVVFKKHWDYMCSIAQDISPLAWSDFFKNSSLFKLKAFSILSSLYLSRPGAKEFIEKFFSFNVEALLTLDPGSAADVRCRIASVFDYPLIPQLGPPHLMDSCFDDNSFSFKGATNIDFRPPAHNPELVEILNGFKFKCLPSIPPEGQVCGWNSPAIFVCNVGIDSRLNIIRSTPYFNHEAERLWGYSTRELYLSTTERDKSVREMKSPPSGCALAPTINR